MGGHFQIKDKLNNETRQNSMILEEAYMVSLSMLKDSLSYIFYEEPLSRDRVKNTPPETFQTKRFSKLEQFFYIPTTPSLWS